MLKLSPHLTIPSPGDSVRVVRMLGPGRDRWELEVMGRGGPTELGMEQLECL